MKEKWYEFVRVICLEGHIDIWTGDAGSNPNNEDKSRYNLNSFATYFRLNDEEWVRSYNFEPDFRSYLYANSESLSAHNIWQSKLNKQ